MSKYKIIPIFVPHKGCPHQCSFCNQKYITGQINEVTPNDVRETIDKYLKTIDLNKHIAEVAFYGGSFTAIDIDYQNKLLSIAYEYKQKGLLNGIRLSTRPDAIDDCILKNLKDKGVTEIELGVQSMCDDVLRQNNRGHSVSNVINAVNLIKKYDFTLGLQMMVGLIGDTKEKSIYTAQQISLLHPDFVRIYPTLVFNNTDLGNLYKRGEYRPLSLEEAIDICRELVGIFDSNHIKIIRLGLYMNEDEAKKNFLAGPYHPRFRELL